MYKSTWEFVRPSLTTSWPSGDAAFDRLRVQAAGFLGKEISITNNNLTKTVVTKWATEEDAQNFLNENSAATVQLNESLAAYCESNNITVTRSIE